MSRRHPYEHAAQRELAAWPDVQAEWLPARGKHPALRLTYAGASRRVVYPGTPGETFRGLLNHVHDVRRALRDLGAVRHNITKA